MTSRCAAAAVVSAVVLRRPTKEYTHRYSMMHRRLTTAGIEVAPHYHQLLVESTIYEVLRRISYKKLKNVRCEYNRLNGWNSTLQAAWYIRRVRIIWFLWTKPTIWLILSFTQNIVRACSMFYPYERYRSVTPLDAARVNRTIFRNHSVHWYYITLIKGRYYIKHDINVRHGKQNPRRGRWL